MTRTPRTPRLAALAVLPRAGRLLLVQRRNPPDAGLWGFPGGKVDWGETVFAAAERELLEETGVRAAAREFLTNLDILVADGEGGLSHHFLLAAVLCEWRAGEPEAADDALAAEWVGFDEVLTRERPMSRDVDRLLRMVLERG
jgi:ADP-ribose pyrophosphatase YjhB (NUDIX family)